MGYSVAVSCRSRSLRDKMAQFLKKEYRNWPMVVGDPEGCSYWSDPSIDALSYHHGKCFIGFDYSPSGIERDYGFCVIRWLAIVIGRKNKKGLPYYVYDGYQAIPILVNADHMEPNCSTVDEFGVPIETPDARKINGVWDVKFSLMVYSLRDDILDVIRNEMRRLDMLWKKANLMES